LYGNLQQGSAAKCELWRIFLSLSWAAPLKLDPYFPAVFNAFPDCLMTCQPKVDKQSSVFPWSNTHSPLLPISVNDGLIAWLTHLVYSLLFSSHINIPLSEILADPSSKT
jgi:hypothetical protein